MPYSLIPSHSLYLRYRQFPWSIERAPQIHAPDCGTNHNFGYCRQTVLDQKIDDAPALHLLQSMDYLPEYRASENGTGILKTVV